MPCQGTSAALSHIIIAISSNITIVNNIINTSSQCMSIFIYITVWSAFSIMANKKLTLAWSTDSGSLAGRAVPAG